MGALAYTQGELQKIIKNAALVGASSVYDDVAADNTPLRNPGNATAAANTTLTALLSGVPWLTAGAPAIVTPCTLGGGDVVTCQATAPVATPFLSLVGINSLTVQANASAIAAKYVVNGFNINTVPGSNPIQLVDLPVPLVDGPWR